MHVKKSFWGIVFILTLITCSAMVSADTAADYIENGNTLVHKKKYAEAIEQYQKAAKKEPKNAQVPLLMGLCYAQLGDLDKGLHYTEWASQNAPSYTSFYDLGLIYSARGESEKALQAFDRASTMNPKSFMLEYQKGLVYATLKKYAQAIPFYQKALALNPSFDDARIALVGAFLNQGNRTSALAEIETFRKMKKNAVVRSLEARMKKSNP